MRFLNYTAPTPAEDLALEEAIHLCVEEGVSPPTWRVWQAATTAVILGTGQEAAKEANLEAAKDARVPVLRRHSGGGAVVIGPGVINFSAFYPYTEMPGSDTIRGAMTSILLPVEKLMAEWSVNLQQAGLSDLAVACKDGMLRKIGGNAQARKKLSFVVHGTLLSNPDWSRIESLLRFPSSSPDYRAGRGHREFLTSLSEINCPSTVDDIAVGLSLFVRPKQVDTAPTPAESERAAKLLAEKYGSDEWNFRR